MKKIKAIGAILILMLTCSAFAQSNEDRKAAAESILCHAVLQGNEPIFLSIMPYYLLMDLNCSCDEKGNTPLQYATVAGRFSMVKTLVIAGASIDTLSFRLAIGGDFFDIVEFFISQDVDLCIKFTNGTIGLPASRYAESEEMRTFLKNAEEQAGLKIDGVGSCVPRQTDTHE